MPHLYHHVIAAQKEDLDLPRVLGCNKVQLEEDDSVWFWGRLFMPLKACQELLDEAHRFKLAIHPGGTKMYHNLKRHFWWPGMKKGVAFFVSKCLTCQQVKARH